MEFRTSTTYDGWGTAPRPQLRRAFQPKRHSRADAGVDGTFHAFESPEGKQGPDDSGNREMKMKLGNTL